MVGQDPVPHLTALVERELGEVEGVDIDGRLDLVRRAAPGMLENLERRPPCVWPTRLEVLAKDGDCFRDELLEGDRPSLVRRRLARAAAEAAASAAGILELGRSQRMSAGAEGEISTGEGVALRAGPPMPHRLPDCN
jgi:hypothetical protein